MFRFRNTNGNLLLFLFNRKNKHIRRDENVELIDSGRNSLVKQEYMIPNTRCLLQEGMVSPRVLGRVSRLGLKKMWFQQDGKIEIGKGDN